MRLLDPVVDEYGAKPPWPDFDRAEFDLMSLHQIATRTIEADGWLGLSRTALVEDCGVDLSKSFGVVIDSTPPGLEDFAVQEGGDQAAEMFAIFRSGVTVAACPLPSGSHHRRTATSESDQTGTDGRGDRQPSGSDAERDALGVERARA